MRSLYYSSVKYCGRIDSDDIIADIFLRDFSKIVAYAAIFLTKTFRSTLRVLFVQNIAVS